MRIGLDFDNTLIGYDHLFHGIAVERGWISASSERDKKAVRDAIRLLPDGENTWTALQAEVYGPRIGEARLTEGAAEFLARARDHHVPLVIISHKSRFAAAAPDGPDLREAALGWMEVQGFFKPDIFGFDKTEVHFAETRKEKCELIGTLQCTHFVDDLEEVFHDPAFPLTTEALLYSPAAQESAKGRFRTLSHWKDIGDACFSKPDQERRSA